MSFWKKVFNFGYRSPSFKEVIGLTKLERKLKKKSGYYTITKPNRLVTNLKKRLKHRVGYYSAPVRFLRRGVPVVKTVGRD